MCECNNFPNSIIGRKPLKLAVVGSRSCTNDMLVYEYLSVICTAYETKEDVYDVEIVSGGAKGPDSYTEKYAMISNISTKVFLPNWDKHSKAAGFIRNKEIVDYADCVLAFWDQKSKGTKHTIDLALKAGKSVWIVPV